MDNKRQINKVQQGTNSANIAVSNNFVLEKGIFSNIFEKDIRRVYIYKKSERLAKAIHLVSPAFRNSPSLRDRMDRIAIGLVDAAILPPGGARDALSKELLALSSVLSIARTGGLLSSMNAEMIAREAQQLLQEVATYEEPRLFLDDAPSLAELAKEAIRLQPSQSHTRPPLFADKNQLDPTAKSSLYKRHSASHKGQVKDSYRVSGKNASRRDAIIAVLKERGVAHIKDISTVIREVSEKTIQRELQALVDSGEVTRSGERRWTTYAIAN